MLNKYRFKKIIIASLLSAVFLLNFITGCSGGGGTSATGKVAEKLELAVKYLTENKFEEAVLAYQEVIKIDKYAMQAYQGLGKVYTLQGKFEDAQKIYQQGVESLKDKALLQLRLSLAAMYIDKGDLKEAERLYKEIISQNADCIEAYRGLALVYWQQGDLQQAKAILEEATKNNSNNDRAYNALASYHIQNGEKDKAMELLVQSLSLNVNQTEAYSALKALYSENWPELVQKAAGIQDQNVAAMVKFYALYESGKHQEALAVYEGQLKQNPNNHKARALAGIAALRAGDRQKAMELIQGMAPDQQNEWVMVDIARYYLLAGETEKAIEWAAKSFESNGQNMEAVKILYEIYSKDNSPLAKIYLAKLIMYNWLPLSVMEQELVANSLEMPFNIDRKSSVNDSNRPEAANGTDTEIVKMIRKVVFDSQDLLDFRQSCQERPTLSARNKDQVYLDNDRNVAYWSVLISEHGVNDSLAFETANGTVLWKPGEQHAFKPLLFRIHKPRIYSSEEVRAQHPTWKALDNYTEFVKADYGYEEVSYEMEFMTLIAKGKPLEEHLKDAGYDLKDFIFIDINEMVTYP